MAGGSRDVIAYRRDRPYRRAAYRLADVMADRHWLTDGTDARLTDLTGIVADRHDRRWLTCRTDVTDRTGLGEEI